MNKSIALKYIYDLLTFKQKRELEESFGVDSLTDLERYIEQEFLEIDEILNKLNEGTK